jgi:hypothetical protein
MSDDAIRDTRFKPGQSGNPAGRRAGSRSKVLSALDALGEGEAESIVKAMIEKAKGGIPSLAEPFSKESGHPERALGYSSICLPL